MPTIVKLQYVATVSVVVPNKIARQLKKQGCYGEPTAMPINGDEEKPWAWGNKWGDIGYNDDKGEHHVIEGGEAVVDEGDMKRTEACEWEEEQESVVDESEHIECEKCTHVHAVDDEKACHESGDEGDE